MIGYATDSTVFEMKTKNRQLFKQL